MYLLPPSGGLFSETPCTGVARCTHSPGSPQ